MAKKRGEFEDVRALILSTAAELFATSGVHATSLADIAEQAKLSKGTLYYYYQSKEHLLNDVADYHLGQITNIMLSWIESLNRETPPRDAIAGLIEMIASDSALACLHIALSAEAAMPNSALKSKFAAKYREWSVMLEVGSLRLPSFKPDKESRTSRLFFMLLDGYMLQREAGVDCLQAEDMIGVLIPGE